MMKDKPDVSIIGKGSIGSAFQRFFSDNGYILKSVWTSTSGLVYSEQNRKPVALDRNYPEHSGELGSLIFITTPDDTISSVVQVLAGLPVIWSGKSVVHCSGNLTSFELASLKNLGASVASMHPIQTFRKGDTANRFDNIYISLEGDDNLCHFLDKLVVEMNAKPVFLTPEQKSLLHIAAVFSSNYVNALMHKVEFFLNDAGVKEGIQVLEPLVRQTVTNIFEKGSAASLTGPISRGDVESVQKHLQLLKNNESLAELYKKLGKEALKIAVKRKEVQDYKLDKLREIFEG